MDSVEGESMDMNLNPIDRTRKSGRERFRDGVRDLDFDLLSFWQWSASDLLSNATRGILAEYLVARGIDADPDGLRDEWAAYDLMTKGGVKVEVKSAAYLQSWRQKKLSTISFVVPKTRAWDRLTNRMEEEQIRQADVYVFALLAHKDKRTVQPLDVSQWIFYVLPTIELDARTRSQHSITLPTLCAMCKEGAVKYQELRGAVVEAARSQKERKSLPASL